MDQLRTGTERSDGTESHRHPGIERGPSGSMKRRPTQRKYRCAVGQIAAELIDLLVQLRTIPPGAGVNQIGARPQLALALPQRQPELGVAPGSFVAGTDGVIHASSIDDERPAIRCRADQLILETNPGGRVVTPLGPYLGVGVIAFDATRCGRVEIVCRERKSDARLEAALQLGVVAREVVVAPGNRQAGSGGQPVVLPGKEVYLKLSGPALDFDAIEQLEREERRINGDAIDAGRNVRYAVEKVLDRGGAPSPVVDQLGAADISAAPEVYPRHLGEQVADR